MSLPCADFRNASMTSLPLARLKSPVWLRTIFMPGCFWIASRKPLARSLAGAAPVVPWSSAMLHWPLVALASHSPAIRPSATKSEAISVVYSSGGADTPRSTRMTGIFARCASRSTGSQPVSTTGAKMIASTRWVMKLRSARIWFSCLPCASANFRSTPRFAASDLIDSVSAVRQALSAPIWEKPTVTLPPLGFFSGPAATVGTEPEAAPTPLTVAPVVSPATWFAAGVEVPERSTVLTVVGVAALVVVGDVAGPGVFDDVLPESRSQAPQTRQRVVRTTANGNDALRSMGAFLLEMRHAARANLRVRAAPGDMLFVRD